MKTEIKESVEELYKLMTEQKKVLGKEKVQALYLLKSGKVKTITELADMSDDICIVFDMEID